MGVQGIYLPGITLFCSASVAPWSCPSGRTHAFGETVLDLTLRKPKTLERGNIVGGGNLAPSCKVFQKVPKVRSKPQTLTKC